MWVALINGDHDDRDERDEKLSSDRMKMMILDREKTIISHERMKMMNIGKKNRLE